MYCLRVKILTLVTIGYIVGFIVGMYIEYCLWAQVAAMDIYFIYWTVWDRYLQVLFLGRAPRTKKTLPDFLKWRRVTRPPLVFHRLTDSQRTPGFWGVTQYIPNNHLIHKLNQTTPTKILDCHGQPLKSPKNSYNFGPMFWDRSTAHSRHFPYKYMI